VVRHDGRVSEIILLGGNTDKRCFKYKIVSDEWSALGCLPLFHLVTQQITMTYQDQTLTLFTNVDFGNNKFKINCAANYGLDSTRLLDEWYWVHNAVTDIDNFCIKTACIYQDKLLALCRGRPRNTLEQCCSFILVQKLKTQGNLVKEFDGEYQFIKLDPLINPEFLTKIHVSNRDNKVVIRMI
jgi:hypothetical protein